MPTVKTVTQLIADINSEITANGVNAITGPILNTLLQKIVASSAGPYAWNSGTAYPAGVIVIYSNGAYLTLSVTTAGDTPVSEPGEFFSLGAAASQTLAETLTAGAVANMAINMNGFRINNLLAPSANGDAVNLGYLITYLASYLASPLVLKGSLSGAANPNYPAGAVGDTYYVITPGLVGGSSGVAVAKGDLVICTTANAGGDQATVGADWTVSASVAAFDPTAIPGWSPSVAGLALVTDGAGGVKWTATPITAT